MSSFRAAGLSLLLLPTLSTAVDRYRMEVIMSGGVIDFNAKGQRAVVYNEVGPNGQSQMVGGLYDPLRGVVPMGTLGTLSDGSYFSYAARINAKGQIGGNSWKDYGNFVWRAVVWDETTGLTEIPTEGESMLHDFNDAGQAIGYQSKESPNGQRYRSYFFYDPAGGVMDIARNDDPTRSFGVYGVYGMNNLGTVAGSFNVGEESHSFLWSRDSGFRDLGALPTANGQRGPSYALEINDAGLVVGGSVNEVGNFRAYTWTESTGMVNLGTLGLDANGIGNSVAYAVNARGQIVGTSTRAGAQMATNDISGFLYEDGTMYDLNDLLVGAGNWRVMETSRIGDAGEILGYATNGFETRQVVLTPTAVPEPATIAALGLGALGLLKRRKRSA